LDPGDDGLRVDGLGGVNLQGRGTPQTQAQALMGAGAPADDILAKLETWLDRLVSALKRIVQNLSDATSFSISVGSNVSVTVGFGRLESSSA
jgi:hypothetical protein